MVSGVILLVGTLHILLLRRGFQEIIALNKLFLCPYLEAHLVAGQILLQLSGLRGVELNLKEIKGQW